MPEVCRPIKPSKSKRRKSNVAIGWLLMANPIVERLLSWPQASSPKTVSKALFNHFSARWPHYIRYLSRYSLSRKCSIACQTNPLAPSIPAPQHNVSVPPRRYQGQFFHHLRWLVRRQHPLRTQNKRVLARSIHAYVSSHHGHK